MNCLLFLLTVSWISWISTSAGIIDVWPNINNVTEGRNLTINCTQSANNTNRTVLNFTWSKYGADNALSHSSQLTFLNISRADSGNYSCTATNGTANWSAIATLKVFYPPEIIYSTGNLTVNESSNSKLSCNASGHPSPTIQWSFPNGSNIRNNGFLEIINTSRSQHGKYVCQATNDIGNSTSIVMYLNVQYAPKINITGREKNISSWLHRNSTLTCQADGNPRPEITWSKDKMELFRGNISGYIYVRPQNSTDFGNYVCTAWNALGKAFFHVKVVRTAFPPDAPTISDKGKQLSSRTLILNWTRPSDNGRPILCYRVWYREMDSNLSAGDWEKVDAGLKHYYNHTLEWSTKYEFAVTAVNDQGESKKSKKEVFFALPEPTTRTTTPPTTTTKKTEGLKDVVLFATIAGCGLLLIVVVIGALYCVKRRHRRARPLEPLVNLSELQSSFPAKDYPTLPNRNTYNEVPQPRVPNRIETRSKESEQTAQTPATLAIYTNTSYLADQEISGWEFPREKVHINKYIGKGAFCVVAKACADGLGTVAVKTPREKAPDSNKKDLLAEYELMKQLRPHSNVIQLMGAVTRSDPIMVIFEYIPYGDLLGFLRRSRGVDDNYYNDPDVRPSSSLTSQQLLKFAREIADGMAFLADNKIIHRDLAARNVLVGEEETCKITDFGMARDVQQNDIYQKRSKGRLPVKWTAVESLLYGRCTSQSDVWSYGIVLYEIFTIGGKPYPNIQAHHIPYMLKDNYRMPKPVHLDDEIYALMCECWKTEPDRRPTFDSISGTVRRLELCHKEVIYMNVYDENLYGNVEDWE